MSNRNIVISNVCDLNSETIRATSQMEVIKYIDTSSITRNRIDNIQLLDRRVAPFPSRAQRKVRNETIIYSTVRPIQEHFGYLINPDDNLIVSSGFITIDVKDKDIDAQYLYYLLTQKNITNYLQSVAVNNVSSYPSISPDDLGNLKFTIPSDKYIQQKVATILSALDNKIELNNRINAQLEAMAKTLYDYWFVQFDFPDKYGKPYKSSGGKMVWKSELKREIPDGWEVGELKDIANITMGQSPPGESYNQKGNGMVFFQGCTDFGSRFPVIREYTTHPTRYAKANDILLSVRAPVGTLNIANADCCIGRGLAALNSKNNCISYLYGVMKGFKQIFDRRNVDGTTFGSITKDDLYSLKVVKPSLLVLGKFQSIIDPAFEKQNLIEFENQSLSSLRDWLLPMLMNGQVKVV